MESDTFWLSVLLKRAWSFQELMFQFGKVAKMEMFVKLIMIYCYSLFNKLDWNISIDYEYNLIGVQYQITQIILVFNKNMVAI